ncbi:MAG: protein TolR [Gammaproteobacteria bacterium]|nr:protein TolR [Gammaproteobacteria bacterium]
MATRRKPMSEINVVPYIDVMLVLLVIFMVAAPLLAQGVLIDLPKEPSQALENADEEPLIVSIRADGAVFLNIGLLEGDELGTRVTHARLQEQVSKITAVRPAVPIFLGADRNITYEVLATTMTTLQNAGAQSIGLMTEPPES